LFLSGDFYPHPSPPPARRLSFTHMWNGGYREKGKTDKMGIIKDKNKGAR
jgi:hypothetical protein